MRKCITAFSLACITFFTGCGGPEVDSHPGQTFPAPPTGHGRRLSVPYSCLNLIYYYDFDLEKWIYFKDGGNDSRVAENQPPCDSFPDRPRKGPSAINVPPSTRSELGLVVDDNGHVAPRIYISSYQEITPGQPSVDDLVSISICAEVDWEMPFDTDARLLDSIGEGNIFCSGIQIDPDGEPEPILIELHQVRLGDAIEVLGRLGVESLTGRINGEVYTAKLDGKLSEYTTVLILDEDGQTIDKITIR